MNSLEGKNAFPFELEGSDGQKHTLNEFSGKKLVLYFYPRDNTPGCTKEAQGFRDLFNEFKALDTVVVGISKDSLASHQKFIEKQSLPFLLLSDPSTEIMATYGAWGEKVLYGKKTIGCIRSTVIIDETGVIIKHWRRVPRAADHPQKVLELLQSL